MALILLRHTSPAVAEGTCYGRTDLDVKASFEEEASAALKSLPPFERVVTSPLRRCAKLAAYISERSQCPVEMDKRFMEMDFGSWERVLWSEIPRGELDAWAADFFRAKPHGGESVAMLTLRVKDALGEYFNHGQRTLVVTHSGVIRAAFSQGQNGDDFDTQIGFGQSFVLTEI